MMLKKFVLRNRPGRTVSKRADSTPVRNARIIVHSSTRGCSSYGDP